MDASLLTQGVCSECDYGTFFVVTCSRCEQAYCIEHLNIKYLGGEGNEKIGVRLCYGCLLEYKSIIALDLDYLEYSKIREKIRLFI